MAEVKTLTEEVSVLFEGFEVSDEQKEKFGVALEAFVSEKVRTLSEAAEAEMESKLEEAKAEQATELEESVNKYLDYVVSEWVEDNKLAIESGMKLDIVEGFMEGIKHVFEEHYVEVPEGKHDLLESAESKAKALESDLNEAIDANMELKAKVVEFEKAGIVAEQSEGLTDTQKEKLSSLVEDVEFKSAEVFAEKVKTIRESFFKASAEEEVVTEETLSEETTVDTKSERMKAYLAAL